jgi:hypothetical protein
MLHVAPNFTNDAFKVFVFLLRPQYLQALNQGQASVNHYAKLPGKYCQRPWLDFVHAPGGLGCLSLDGGYFDAVALQRFNGGIPAVGNKHPLLQIPEAIFSFPGKSGHEDL